MQGEDKQRSERFALSVAASPDGRRLAVGCMDGTVAVFDSESGALLCTLQGHFKAVRSLAFTPGGRPDAVHAAWARGTAQPGAALRCAAVPVHLDCRSRHRLPPRMPHPVLADSKMLLTACDDMHSHLYDVEHGALVEAFSGEVGGNGRE